jgi:hypothetical protein
MPIDIHAHYAPPNILEAVEQRAREFAATMVRRPPSRACNLHSIMGPRCGRLFADRLAAMAKQRVDRQVLSPSASSRNSHRPCRIFFH